jgi:hypothetical protein
LLNIRLTFWYDDEKLGHENKSCGFKNTLYGLAHTQPIFLKNLLTTIRPDPIYVVATLSLTYQGGFL